MAIDGNTINQIVIGLTGAGGVATGVGLIKLSNTVAALAPQVESLDTRLIRVEDTVFPTTSPNRHHR